MNPLFVLCVFGLAFFVWLCSALLFPKIGGFIKDYFDAMKGMMKESEDEDE